MGCPWFLVGSATIGRDATRANFCVFSVIGRERLVQAVHIVRAMLRAAAGLLLLAACAAEPNLGEVEQIVSGKASVSLTGASAAPLLTSDSAWTLAKTGAVNTTTKQVTWTITATKVSTVSGHLFVDGFMSVTNSGARGATIGNIVVNLQGRSGNTWVSRSVDIADATHDDAATHAFIDSHASSEGKSSFTENGGSGELLFMDANTNSVFALDPEKTIAPGQTVNLLFSAEFDNNVLHLAQGTPIRAEVIVSFGNAGPNGPVAANTDINGNGAIDPDEQWVRSIPARLGMTVPSVTNTNSSPTISDTASDIVATGTAAFSNASFNLGATTGTVTVSYTGGANGGALTNCAHLTGAGTTVNVNGFQFPIPGVDLTACDTESVPADSGGGGCTTGEPGCGWADGDMLTYDQDDWGSSATTAGGTLAVGFGSVYPSGAVEVGTSGSSGFSMIFDGSTAIYDYLPATGAAGPLTADLFDPTTSSSGVFGGDVLALQLDVDFSDAGLVTGTSGLKLGDLLLCGASPIPSGTSVRSFLSIANTALGGAPTGYAISDLDSIASAIDLAFRTGAPSTFAQSSLFASSCP